MDFNAEISAASTDPHKLEQLYQSAMQNDQVELFRSNLLALHETDPGNLLYAAWFYRLQQIPVTPAKSRFQVNWIAAVPLSIFTALIFWALSDFDRPGIYDDIPHLLLSWSPIATTSALLFLALTAKQHYGRALSLGVGLFAVAAYAVVLAQALNGPWMGDQFFLLALIHIPLLCWIALGFWIKGFKLSIQDRFAFLKKSMEVGIVAGLYLIAGMAFGGIAIAMFEALNIQLPDIWLRLMAAGGVGLLPILAVATVYDPKVAPSEQDFRQGLSKFIATMMRLMLPLTLIVLVIYIIFIPFNFMEPYDNRDLLIVYNLMLFAVIGMLLGATPVDGDDLSPSTQNWLRNGIVVVAILASLVTLYALSATGYRTVKGGLTFNRLAIIGWNIINLTILIRLIMKQFRDGRENWIASLHSVYGYGVKVYVIWGMILVVVVPLFFLIAK